MLAGALMLEACVPWMPAGAIHLAVVDPGVGTARRAVCLVDGEGRRFVAPDNGLLTPFAGPGAAAFEIEPGRAVPRPASATFHGRDLFAPAALHLARGGAPSELGRPVPDLVRVRWPEAAVHAGEVEGEVLIADPFGNLVTSIRARDLGEGAPVRAVWVGERPARWVRTFGEGAPGELVALVGSRGRVEVAVREGSAAAATGGARGIRVRIGLAPR